MRSRRTLVGGLACAVLTITVPPRAAAASQVADEPAAIVTAIYTRPVDFDPVTNSQDPDVKSFKVIAEKQDAAKATIAVTLNRPGF